MIFLILCFCILFASCSDPLSEENFYVLKFKGHTYIYYEKPMSYGCGFVYDPDCVCFK